MSRLKTEESDKISWNLIVDKHCQTESGRFKRQTAVHILFWFIGSLLHTRAKSRPRYLPWQVGGCNCLSLKQGISTKCSGEGDGGRVLGTGGVPACFGAQGWCLCPIPHADRCLCCPGALGCCWVTRRAQDEELSVREFSCILNISVFPSSSAVYAKSYRQLFVVFGGGWCPGGQWGHLTWTDACGTMLCGMDWWSALAWWYIRPVSSCAARALK